MSSNFCSLFISTIKLSRLLLSIIHPIAIRTKQPAASQENDVKLLQYFFDQAPRRLFKISVEKRTAQTVDLRSFVKHYIQDDETAAVREKLLCFV